MTDLVSLSDIHGRLLPLAETRVPLGAALAELQEMRDAYEADRVASDSTISTIGDRLIEQSKTISALEIENDALKQQLAVATADVHVTVGTNSIISHLAPALTWVSNPNTWRQPGWPNAKANTGALVGAQSTHLSSFGNSTAWEWSGTGTLPPKPNNLYGETNGGGTVAKPAANSFVGSLKAMRDVDPSGPLHCKVFMPEYFMKHTVMPDGSIVNVTYADRFNAEAGRLKFTHLAEWKLLVTTACKIAMAAPYNVRYFSVHNELKGYWDGVNQRYDMTYNAGSDTTPMGFVYFYEQTSQAIVAAATALNIPATDIKIGGPYCTLRGRGKADATAVPVGHALRDRPWGHGDKHGVNALQTFLTEVKARGLKLDFISVDGADGNKDGIYPAPDDFVNGQRWHDWHLWIRAELAKRSMDATMPIVWDEWYRKPVVKPPTGTPAEKQALWTALKADTLMTMALDGVQWPFSWGPVPIVGDDNVGSLLTDTAVADGGQVAAYGALCKLFKDNFPPGTKVYPLICSDGRVGGMASDSVTLVSSRTPLPLSVDVDGKVITLAGFEVRSISQT